MPARIAAALAAAVSLAASAACAHAHRPPASGPPPSLTPTSPDGPAANRHAAPGTAVPAPPPEPEPAPTPAPPPETSSTTPVLPITVAAVGDVMMGSTFPDETGGLLPPEDGRLLFAEVQPLLAAADVAFGNLEGPLADGGTSEKCAHAKPGRCYAFRTPARYAGRLQDAGFGVVSLANNHAADFGEAGRASTRLALERVGIRYAGAPGEVARMEVRGTRVALVAFSTSGGTNDLRDLPEAARIVGEAAREADVVVVSFHGGAEGADRQHVPPGTEEFLGEDRGDLRAFARTVVAAGADLVIGHGPHVVRGMEVLNGRLIAYSLGNFATYGGMNLSGPNGLTLVLEVRLAKDGAFLGGRIHPAVQEKPGGPRLDPAGAIIPVVRELSRADFGPTAVQVAEDGTLRPPAPPAADAGIKPGA
jgi:hypothetical protein